MALRGSVKAFRLSELFEFLHASGHRGTLSVSQKATAAGKTLYLYQGGIFVERGEWTFRLGNALVRRGFITRDQLDAALVRQKETGVRLGETLIELGATTAQDILAARRFQVEEEIHDIFAWDDAVFEFEKDHLPASFEIRIQDPEEFRFDVRSILIETARRDDEWRHIHEHIPSQKRIFLLGEKVADEDRKGIHKAFAEARVAASLDVFDGRRTVEELLQVLGLSHFETLSLVARFVAKGWIRPLQRHELEARFRVAVEEDMPYAQTLYESALETPEFEARGKYLDRAIFGSPRFREHANKSPVSLTARIRGKRALEVLLSIFRQGLTGDFQATEEGRTLGLAISRSAIVWRGKEGEPPDVLRHLLARHPIAEADLRGAREMQKNTDRTLQQVLVGGGYATMDNWFRAQMDAVLSLVFDLFFWKRPFIEVLLGRDQSGSPGESGVYKASPEANTAGMRIEVPMLPWLRTEVADEIKRWETITSNIPTVRGFYVLSAKGQKAVKGAGDVLNLFDGKRPLEEVMKAQKDTPQAFFLWLNEQIAGGRVEPLAEDAYLDRVTVAVEQGRRKVAIDYCVAAVESGLQVRWFQDKLKALEAAEAQVETLAARPTIRGDLASFSLAEVLQSLFMGKRTGTLRIFEGDRSRDIYVIDGHIFILLEGYEQAEAALLEEGSAPPPPPGANLAEKLADEVKAELYEVFLWDTAEFEFASDLLPAIFYADALSPWRVRVNTAHFLMEAVQRIAKWELVRSVLPSDDLKLAFVSQDSKMGSVRAYGNPELLLLIDGHHSVAEALRMSGAKRFQSLCLLADLFREGALRIIDEGLEGRRTAPGAVARTRLSGPVDRGTIIEALRTLRAEGATGIVRVTDGRRSREIAFLRGETHRTTPWRGGPGDGQATRESASDFAEVMAWSDARWEFMNGTLPPILHGGDEEARAPYLLDGRTFVDQIEKAAPRWLEILAEVPKDKSLALAAGELALSRATELVREAPEVLSLIDGTKTADDVGRLATSRFEAMSAILSLLREDVLVAVDPPAKAAEEEWDLGL